jgi:hypothetical protein
LQRTSGRQQSSKGKRTSLLREQIVSILGSLGTVSNYWALGWHTINTAVNSGVWTQNNFFLWKLFTYATSFFMSKLTPSRGLGASNAIFGLGGP